MGPLFLAAVLSWGSPPPASPAEVPLFCPPPPVCACPSPPAQPPIRPRIVPGIAEDTAARTGANQWYGGPILGADLVSIGMMVGAFASKNAGLLFFGGTGYTLVAPINHVVKGRPGLALASFGLRAVAMGLATGAIIEDVISHHCDGDVSPCGAPTAGIALGTLIAIGAAVVDDALLARGSGQPAQPGTPLAPGLTVGRNAAVLSLGGRF